MNFLLLAAILAVAHGAVLDRFSVHTGLSMWPDNNFQRIQNTTPEECAEKCLAGTFPGCRSFRYKTEHHKCDLLIVEPDENNVLTTSTQGWDFYVMQKGRSAALGKFLAHMGLSMWPDNNYQRIENTTPEECAEKCLAGTFPGCRSFRYKTEHHKCDLLVVTPDGDNVLTTSTQGWDFYTMETAALVKFSAHMGLSMWPDNNYQRIENTTPEECAEKCLAGEFPGCKSFRYKTEHQKCDLLVVTPDGDNVLTTSTQGWDFYTMETAALVKFSAHIGLSMWPDNNYQRIENTTPEECAEKCLAGEFPGCKSFRYKTEHQKCDLLVVTPDGDNPLTASTQGWDFYTMEIEQPAAPEPEEKVPIPEPKERSPYTACESGTISSNYCHWGAVSMAECFNGPKIAVFKKPFLETPAVTWGITHADLNQNYNTRVDVAQVDLDATQLTLQFNCWADSHCFKVMVSFMACGLVSEEY